MIFSRDEQAIVAQCTPRGSGALAIIRISGINAFDVTQKISALESKQLITTLPSHTIHYGWVIDDNQDPIDQLLFLLMRGPRTFTGQDTVEITPHNNQFIIDAIIQRAVLAGARVAQEGEFSKRAVLNGKIDLLQAEAINELIHANTQMSLKQSLSQLTGSFSHWISLIEKDLVKCIALSEASFEFIEEADVTFEDTVRTLLHGICERIQSLKQNFDQQQQLRQGVRIAVIGSVNAGKSSLFNALVKKDRAIVTNVAGTTRDVIEAGLYKNGTYRTLIDTAGIRQANNVIEQEGIRRSHIEAKLADIVLLVYDTSCEMSIQEVKLYQQLYDEHRHKVIPIANKVDLLKCVDGSLPDSALAVSVKNNMNINRVEAKIEDMIGRLFSGLQSPFLLNQRQYTLLLSLEKNIQTVCQVLDDQKAFELVSYHLNDSLSQVSELTGKTVSEQAMDAVFKEFCVGK